MGPRHWCWRCTQYTATLCAIHTGLGELPPQRYHGICTHRTEQRTPRGLGSNLPSQQLPCQGGWRRPPSSTQHWFQARRYPNTSTSRRSHRSEHGQSKFPFTRRCRRFREWAYTKEVPISRGLGHHYNCSQKQPPRHRRARTELSPTFMCQIRMPHRRCSTVYTWSPIILVDSLAALITGLPTKDRGQVSAIASSRRFRLGYYKCDGVTLHTTSAFSHADGTYGSISTTATTFSGTDTSH